MALGLEKTKGEVTDRKALSAALQKVEFESPRGPFRFSSARNPIQNIYAIEAKNGALSVLEVMQKDVTDPVEACKA
jgi:branched-chain amino acid transport system substrate-binding protein